MAVKLLTVVGARPQFIKAAMVSRVLGMCGNVEEVLIHTGQHHDYNMSEQFFEELAIPRPKVNLGISGGTHARMTAKMMVGLEEAMISERPQAVLLYGDTNSTLAAALAAAKLHIPVLHVEAGARTHSRTNPEEINRVCVDHVASLDFAPTLICYENLRLEGLEDHSSFVGDVMLDAFTYYSREAESSEIHLVTLSGKTVQLRKDFYYLTCHREENSDVRTIREVLGAAALCDGIVVYPVHPRMKACVSEELNGLQANNVLLIEPVGYLDSIALVKRAKAIITDSGGLQREAFFAKKKCVTLLPFPSTDELLLGGRNTLVPQVTEKNIIDALGIPQTIDDSFAPFGDGEAAEKIVERCLLFLGKDIVS